MYLYWQLAQQDTSTNTAGLDNWQQPPRQSHEMVLLDDNEPLMEVMQANEKKHLMAQTEAATPWRHRHQSTSTHFLQGKISQTDSLGESR